MQSLCSFPEMQTSSPARTLDFWIPHSGCRGHVAKSCPGSFENLALVDVAAIAAGNRAAAAVRRPAERLPFYQITLNFMS